MTLVKLSPGDRLKEGHPKLQGLRITCFKKMEHCRRKISRKSEDIPKNLRPRKASWSQKQKYIRQKPEGKRQ